MECATSFKVTFTGLEAVSSFLVSVVEVVSFDSSLEVQASREAAAMARMRVIEMIRFFIESSFNFTAISICRRRILVRD